MDLFKLVGSVFIDTSDADSSIKKTSENAEGLGDKLTGVGDKFKKAGDKVSKIGSSLTKTVTAPIVGIGTASVVTAANFDSSMSQVQATMGLTKDATSELNGEVVNTMDALSNLAIQMGSTTAFSASECADAINTLAMAGLDTQEIYDVLPDTLNLAAAGGIEIADAASYVTGAVKGFGDEMNNASKYSDLIAKGAALANTDVTALGTAMSDISATASTYGQTAEGTTKALLRLAEANVTGSEASTGLSAAMTRVYAPTNEAKKAMDELCVSAYNADGTAKDFNDVVDELSAAMGTMGEEQANATAKTIFGTSRLAIYNDMAAASTETLDKFDEGLENASGSAEEMANTQLDNLNGQMTLLKSALEGAAIAIGQKLIPWVTKCINKVQSAVDWFNNLTDGQKTMIMVIAGVVAAIGPLLMILGSVLSFIGTLSTAAAALGVGIGALAAPIAIAIAAISAMIAIGITLYKNWDKIKETAKAFKEYIAKRWAETKEETVQKFQAMKDGVKQKFEDMKSGAIEKVESMKSKIKQKFEDIKSSITDKIDGAKKNVKDAIDKIKGFFNFSFKWPKLTLPHFKATGGEFPWGMLGQGKAPKISVEWYAKAMDQARILTDATPFAVSGGKIAAGGEAGNEVVSGEAHLIELIQGAVGSVTADLLSQILEVLREMNGSMYDRIVSALQTMGIKFDERELARLVRKYA